jgi:hypothetical protein
MKNILCIDTIKNIYSINRLYKKLLYTNLNIYKLSYFKNLYNNIKSIIKKINIISDNLEIKNYKNKISLELLNNNFTSSPIKNYILNNLKNNYQIINENDIIIYSTKKTINNKSKIPNVILHMFKIIKLLKILFKRNNSNNSQTIYYFETNKKKTLPANSSKKIGPNECNSGLTYIQNNNHKNGNIVLYRKEEILKVLIHELIHSNMIDHKIIYSTDNKAFSNNFCVDYNILLNEAFTETFATIINIFYIHVISNLKISLLNKMFINELCYSNYICSKIMNYYDIESILDVIKPKDKKCNTYFPQNTNVFSYYILKNILLHNIEDFNNILINNTVDYKINEHGIKDLINLIMFNIKKFDNNIITFRITDKSLRMCLYEILL